MKKIIYNSFVVGHLCLIAFTVGYISSVIVDYLGIDLETNSTANTIDSLLNIVVCLSYFLFFVVVLDKKLETRFLK